MAGSGRGWWSAVRPRACGACGRSVESAEPVTLAGDMGELLPPLRCATGCPRGLPLLGSARLSRLASARLGRLWGAFQLAGGRAGRAALP